jgi:hypothetical protein
VKNATNKVLGAVATGVGAAGAVVAASASGLILPAIVVKIAMHIVTWGTVVGVVAAKVLPGNGKNSNRTPKPDARGQVADAEDPR